MLFSFGPIPQCTVGEKSVHWLALPPGATLPAYTKQMDKNFFIKKTFFVVHFILKFLDILPPFWGLCNVGVKSDVIFKAQACGGGEPPRKAIGGGEILTQSITLVHIFCVPKGGGEFHIFGPLFWNVFGRFCISLFCFWRRLVGWGRAKIDLFHHVWFEGFPKSYPSKSLK